MDIVQVGQKGPDFELPTDDGVTVSLAALRGRPVVLFFYPKDDTSGCTAEAVDFTALKPQFDELGIALLGLSPDGIRKHRKFKDKHGLTVTLLSDEEKSVVQAYGVWVEKSMYGRKYMGVERTTVLFDAEGKVARVWSKVKVPGHAAEVLEAARALA